RRPVAFAERAPVQRDRSPGDVDPRVAPGAQPEVAGLPRGEDRHRDVHVLLYLEALLAAVSGGEEGEAALGRPPVEGPLGVGRREAPRVRYDPDLQEMHGLGARVVVLAVPDAGPRPHELHLARADDAPAPRAVLVAQRPLEDVREDLHVLV